MHTGQADGRAAHGDHDDSSTGRPITRRQLLASFGLAGAAAALAGPSRLLSRPAARQLVSRAAATSPAGSDLGAVEHIVFLMMENRSYDHYFGAYPNGRGFDDHPKSSLGVFAQSYPGASNLSPPDVLLPFHLSSSGGEVRSAPTTSPTTGDRSICAGTAGRWTASSPPIRPRPTRAPTGR